MPHRNDGPTSEVDENLLHREHNVPIIVSVTRIETEQPEETQPCHIREESEGIPVSGPRVSQRWVLAMMGCLAIANAHMMRTCLPLILTNIATAPKISMNNTKSDGTCPATLTSTYSNSSNSGTYDWDEYTQGIAISSFYWGYLITQLPGGLLADKYGGKYTLGLGILSTAVLNLLIPIVIQSYDSTGLIILRVIMGVGQGPILPAIAVLLSAWAPPLERSKIGTLVMSGISLGIVLGNSLSGILMRYSSGGWPVVFYVFGAIGVLWFTAWVILCYNNPNEHPFISETEKKYLRKAMINYAPTKTPPTPWRHLLISAPMWAFLLAKTGYSWGLHTATASQPKYMGNVLKFSIHVNGVLTALPHVFSWLVGNAISWPADWSIKNDKISRSNVRKILYAVGSLLPGISFVTASYAGCDWRVVVILFMSGTAIMGMNFASVMVNSNDLSPNHAGTLMAIGNSITCLTGMTVPYVIGVLTPNQTLSEWRIIFWICFFLYCLTTLTFSIYADGEVQYWNDLDYRANQNNHHQKGGQNDRKAHKTPSLPAEPYTLVSN